MAGKTLQFKIDFLKLLLLGTALANVWDNAASSPITNLQLSFHTADPGPGNDQTVNEIVYGTYARVAIARTSGGWTIDPTTGIVTPAATITFSTPTTGSGTVTHVGIGRDASGTGYLFASGAITPNIIITVGVPPQLTVASQWTES